MANLVPGAAAKTDGWYGYPGASGLIHDPQVVGKMAAPMVLGLLQPQGLDLGRIPRAAPQAIHKEVYIAADQHLVGTR